MESKVKHHFPKHIYISGRKIGPGERCYIIAEGGVSHLGDQSKALKLIDISKSSGADVFKTQHYRTDSLVGPSAPEWRRRLRSKEMSDSAIRHMRDYCDLQKIPFLCTAHDEDVLDFLDGELKLSAFKIGSGEVENWPFLANVAKRGKPIILSTGMYQLSQIKDAITILWANGCRQLAILHCITSYPAAPVDVNLRVMHQIREFFDGPVGYSDHTAGAAVPLAAVALGASVIEKHITLDLDIPDAQDWKVACTEETFPRFVKDIRTIESSLGTGEKILGEAEIKSISWARKSITAKTEINPGELILPHMLTIQRPGTGLPGSRLSEMVGCRAVRYIPSGAIITVEMFQK